MKKTHLLFMAITLLFSGCGKDTSTPAKALIGHWRYNSGAQLYYSTDGKCTWIDKTGDITYGSYEVTQQNIKDRSITVKMKTYPGTYLILQGKYSQNYKKIVQDNIRPETIIKYVDTQQGL